MNYDIDRHEKLVTIPWDESKVNQTIDEICKETINYFDRKDYLNSTKNTFYKGEVGSLWGLNYLSKKRNLSIDLSFSEIIENVIDAYHIYPDTRNVVPSYFLGELGILLCKWQISPSEELKHNIVDNIESNMENQCCEFLWGAPGTMLAPLFMFKWTNDKLFKELYLKNVYNVLSMWKYNLKGNYYYWEYKINNRIKHYIGAAHGFWGNVFSLLKGQELISKEKIELVITRTIAMTERFAKIEKDTVNWPCTFHNADEHFLVQWCHGAPGMIAMLDIIPQGFSSVLDDLMIKAGNLIWKAGPLRKGVALCHGTDGNGLALLKLFNRTSNSLWLERSKAFAMHAIERRNGDLSLWTGDVGLAYYLQACLNAKGDFPGVDFF